MNVHPFLLIFGVALTEAASSGFQKCYNPEVDFYPLLSTRTAYQRVHGNLTRPESSCVPVQIWMLARHGTRYPGKSKIPQLLNLVKVRDEIIENHKRGDGQLCPRDVENFEKWIIDPNLKLEMADILAPQGKEDLLLLAKRLQKSFPELLQTDARIGDPNEFIFRGTDTQRTQASLKSFARGLFPSGRSIESEKAPTNDTLLLAHKNCPAWEVNYHADQLNAERNKFTEGPEIKKVLKDVSQRLGFVEQINFDLIKSMYEMCRFEAAWYLNQTSTWCSVFSKEDLQVLEYREDLDYYYCCGPGRELSVKLGCQTLSDMFKHFKNLENGDYVGQPKGVFYFSHTITLQSLMAALKIGRETKPFLASGYASSQDRNYRTSFLGPFATNVVAVFYRCHGETSPNKVMFYVAEKKVQMEGCKNGLCDWEFLKKEFSPDVDQCSMDECFKIPKNNTEMQSDGAVDNSSSGLAYTPLLAFSLIFQGIWSGLQKQLHSGI